MTLIVPTMIMQAKTTSRSEQAEEETEEKRQSGDAEITFRRQTTTAAWGRPRPRQRDHEGGALPHNGKSYGTHAGRP